MPRRKQVQSHPPEPQFHTIAEVCVILSLGRTKVYDLIRREHLPMQKFGRSTRIPIKRFEQWLRARSQGIA
jgi:excisionase family DNA binding protein